MQSLLTTLHLIFFALSKYVQNRGFIEKLINEKFEINCDKYLKTIWNLGSVSDTDSKNGNNDFRKSIFKLQIKL